MQFKNTIERTLANGRVVTLTKNIVAGAINVYSLANGALVVKTGGAISNSNIAKIIDADSYDSETGTYDQITNEGNAINNYDIISFTKDIDNIVIVLDGIELSRNLWVYNSDVFSVDAYMTGTVVARQMELVEIGTASSMLVPEPSTVALLLSGCMVVLKKKRS